MQAVSFRQPVLFRLIQPQPQVASNDVDEFLTLMAIAAACLGVGFILDAVADEPISQSNSTKSEQEDSKQ